METPLENLGLLIYAVSPNKTTFQYAHEVPNYIEKAVPFVLSFVLLDTLVLLLRRKKISFGDSLTSMSAGFINDSVRVATIGIEFLGYDWMYKHRLIDWQWDSIWAWILAFVCADFGFYIAHRAGHEMAIFWAAHAAHHDSQFFNAFNGMRQATFRRFFSIGVYLPGAILGVPYPAMLVHVQLTLIYQFWLHTENIPPLGPIEWIFNTPSLHKVHHGSNKWCLDKNYAGVLIIFDRLLGTFQPMRYDEEIVFGVTNQPQTFEPIYLQIGYIKIYIEKALSMQTFGDKLRALFYGPGWYPGTPRLGDPDNIPDKLEPRPIYNPPIEIWLRVYSCIHFLLVVIFHHKFALLYQLLPWYEGIGFMLYLLSCFSVIGHLFDGHPWAPQAEALRCIATFLWILGTPVTHTALVNSAVLLLFGSSALFWLSMITFSAVN